MGTRLLGKMEQEEFLAKQEEQIYSDLKSDEGFKDHAYQDHLGYWTLGYGFLIDERKGGNIPAPIAELWLKYNVYQVIKELDSKMPWWSEQPFNVQRALVNMSYQLGVSGVLKFRNMLSSLKEGNREEAAVHALDSKWAQQTPNRANRVAGWIRQDKEIT